MARFYGMGIAPVGVLGSGAFKRTGKDSAGAGTLIGVQDAELARTVQALTEVADELGTEPAAVALAWARQKAAYVVPVVGGARVEQLQDTIAALAITLSPKQMATLEEACPFDHGFPANHFGSDPHYLPGGVTASPYLPMGGAVKFVEYP